MKVSQILSSHCVNTRREPACRLSLSRPPAHMGSRALQGGRPGVEISRIRRLMQVIRHIRSYNMHPIHLMPRFHLRAMEWGIDPGQNGELIVSR